MWVPAPTIVGPGAHGKSLVEADLPIGAASLWVPGLMGNLW